MGIPDSEGYFGPYGGQFVPETLMPALLELEEAYQKARDDSTFQNRLDRLRRDYSGRPTPLYQARRLGEAWGAEVLLKREDLNHTGAHKINNCLGQVLLAETMGKKRIIAETGAGQHGVATATVCALFGLECIVFMGDEDIRRQAPNVTRMQMLGAEVRPVHSGRSTLKDATNEALRDWVSHVRTTFYLLGSTVGPHPYPLLVRDFQKIIGQEARAQSLEQIDRLPGSIVACVGGGSNAMGIFHAFLEDTSVALVGVEAGGDGGDRHAASLVCGSPGVLHGAHSYLLQDEQGQVRETHSISAGLDYPGVGPEHSYLHDTGRVRYTRVEDRAALEAFVELTRLEGILPALESSHALAEARRMATEEKLDGPLLVNLSGRGDKDMDEAVRLLEQTRGTNR